MARKENYLTHRGWRKSDVGWVCGRHTVAPLKLSKALHHQLTEDLCGALAANGWKVVGFSPRGYAKLEDPTGKGTCTLPEALRRQARRENRYVGEFTYVLFLSAIAA